MKVKNYLTTLFFIVGLSALSANGVVVENSFVERCLVALSNQELQSVFSSYCKNIPSKNFSIFAIPSQNMCLLIDTLFMGDISREQRYQSNEVVAVVPALSAYHLAMMNAEGYFQVPRPGAVVPPALIVTEQPTSSEELALLVQPNSQQTSESAAIVIRKKRKHQSQWRLMDFDSLSEKIDIVIVCGLRAIN
ncbi:hypothetical protein FJ366_00365 [Candidatus Dependentiae bacterium]|nr:hypothetical protein [Candidatus Dependentiae bacterium]